MGSRTAGSVAADAWNNEQKADTMKTYILRDPNPVEPQKSRLVQTPLEAPDPATEALAGHIVTTAGRGPALYIGLDVHTESIAVSLAPSDSTELRRYGLIGGTHDDVLRLAKKLAAAHPGLRLEFWYEAGPHGYPLCRFLRRHGYGCNIASPSKIPRKPGERVKTNRRDADAIARLSRAGELSSIHVPEPEDEAVRDFLRARWQTAKHQHRARQQLKSFLLRHNFRYAGTKAWTQQHLNYLATVKMPFAEQQVVFQEQVNLISEAGKRLERYDSRLIGVVEQWRFEPVVRALMSMRGLALLNAATLAAELGDLHRFETARQLMGYLGLCPSEDSTGNERHQGGITKMGNGIARRALIEAAWNYSKPARISRDLLKRQEGLSQEIKDVSWNAQTRLHQRYKHLTGPARKKKPVAAAALGRELSGFVWAVGRMVQPRAAGAPIGAGAAGPLRVATGGEANESSEVPRRRRPARPNPSRPASSQ
jgi:transposase